MKRFCVMLPQCLANYQIWILFAFYYRPQRSCGQGYVFTRVCDSVNRGGSLENPPGTRQPPPPGPGNHTPPGTRQPPQDQSTTPPGTRQPPPRTRQKPPSPHFWKNTAAYGQWAAGTHPTGMHSCLKVNRLPIDVWAAQWTHLTTSGRSLCK